MNRRPLLALSLVCVIALSAWKPLAPPEPPANVTSRAWKATGANASVDLIVTAPGFPDLSPAQTLSTKEAKTRFVVAALLAHTATSQAQLRADLTARGMAFTPLWVTNQIVVRNAARADVQWLAARRDVTRVDVDVQTRGIESGSKEIRDKRLVKSLISYLLSPSSPASIEWGVTRVNAPQVWAMGYTGQGIVVADLDTGVRWDHTALKPKYRGWNVISATVDHNYSWFDAAPDGGSPSPTPVDVNGHGTHTTGTVIGDDGAGNQIGVAPNAQWIACRNMAGSSGIGSVARYTACFQFALAPTDVNGNNPDPAKGADITTNSWGCDPAYGEIGCDVPSALVTVTQVLRDAGVMVVASAGNDGSACRTVINAPGTLDQAFSIGATDSGNVIAGFSSRGPSSLTGKIKPDVVAPGVGVRSATFDSTTSYGFKSGTSMASPHVAGVVALLWSAAPKLRGDVSATEAILRATAKPLADVNACGGTPGSAVPNNTYGYGLIDAQAAVQKALTPITTTVPMTSPARMPITFTIAIANDSASAYTNVIIRSGVPPSATVLASNPTGTITGNTIQWTLPSIAPSTTVTVSYVISTTAALTASNAPVQVMFDGASQPIMGKPATTVIGAAHAFLPWINR